MLTAALSKDSRDGFMVHQFSFRVNRVGIVTEVERRESSSKNGDSLSTFNIGISKQH